MTIRTILAFLFSFSIFTSRIFFETQAFTPITTANSKGGLLNLNAGIPISNSKIVPFVSQNVPSSSSWRRWHRTNTNNKPITPLVTTTTTATILRLSSSGGDGGDDLTTTTTRESDEIILGVGGTIAALVMMYSEFVLSQTGCGLPAGPFGLVGGIEGISYLSVVGLGGYSLYKKVTTGSGLPAGKFGLLGLAEGLAFLALFAGIIVLVLQITNFGYIPNAVPMEGGMCK